MTTATHDPIRETTKGCALHRYHAPRPHINDLHHVWPLGMGGPADGAVVPVCQTGHRIVHEFLDMLVEHDGNPPAVLLRRFGVNERALAARGFFAWVAAGKP